MSGISVDKHLASEPDVVVRVYPEKNHLPPFTTLHIDEFTFYTNSFMFDLEKQLDVWARLGANIVAATMRARPEIPKRGAA